MRAAAGTACLVVALTVGFPVEAFQSAPSRRLSLHMAVPRREYVSGAIGTFSVLAGVAGFAEPAQAAGDIGDFSRLQKGLEGLNYLLDNWVQETTLCNPECNRSPDSVRFYLGRRSTEHPLYKIENLLNGKPLLGRVDPDTIEDFVAAVEAWNTAISQADQMAYTSMFGEYNPGGGKDEVEKYLELSRKEVISARDSLAKIIQLADL